MGNHLNIQYGHLNSTKVAAFVPYITDQYWIPHNSVKT